jgi:hypothetical protein
MNIHFILSGSSKDREPIRARSEQTRLMPTYRTAHRIFAPNRKENHR